MTCLNMSASTMDCLGTEQNNLEIVCSGKNRMPESDCKVVALQGAGNVVVEPLLRDTVEFSALVLDGKDGAVSSMPLEIRIQDPDEIFIDAEMEVHRFFSKTKVNLFSCWLHLLDGKYLKLYEKFHAAM